jgi:hypothetical protein
MNKFILFCVRFALSLPPLNKSMKKRMNRRHFTLFLLFLFIIEGLMAQSCPKREFRGAWIQAVNGQFQGMAPEKMQQVLIDQLKPQASMPSFFRYVPKPMRFISLHTNHGAASLPECRGKPRRHCGILCNL